MACVKGWEDDDYRRWEDEENCASTPVSATYMEPNSTDAPMGEEKTQGLATRFRITVISYRKRKHDPDGVSVKAVLDGLTRAGLLPDDSTDEIEQITFKSIIEKEEKTVIEIEEVAQDIIDNAHIEGLESDR